METKVIIDIAALICNSIVLLIMMVLFYYQYRTRKIMEATKKYKAEHFVTMTKFEFEHHLIVTFKKGLNDEEIRKQETSPHSEIISRCSLPEGYEPVYKKI